MGKENICNHDAPPGAHIIHSPLCDETNPVPAVETEKVEPIIPTATISDQARTPVGSGT